jgi:hypothetical protein
MEQCEGGTREQSGFQVRARQRLGKTDHVQFSHFEGMHCAACEAAENVRTPRRVGLFSVVRTLPSAQPRHLRRADITHHRARGCF